MFLFVAGLLLATGWGTAAAAQLMNVFVTNGPDNPVAVAQQGAATIAGSVGIDPAKNTVTVTGQPGNPLPVHDQGTLTIGGTVSLAPTGNTVTVGNTPSVQLAGNSTVNVGNLPAVQEVTGKVSSGDTTSVLAENSVQGQVNNNQNSVGLIGPVDTSKAREVRLTIECFETSECANLEVDVFTSSSFSYQLDSFTLGADSATRVYDIPGPNFAVQAFHSTTGMLIATEVVGRGN
jgi:hypothetical protein